MDRLNKFIRPLGYLLTFAALIYLVNIIAHFDWYSMKFKNSFASVFFTVLFGFWASLFLFIGAYNWKLILEFVNGESVSTKDVFHVYLKSNVAKYLPGNVMHYAGRNYLGNKLGWNNSEMAFSSFLEFIFGAGSTGIIIIMLLALGFINIPPQISFTFNFHKIVGYSALVAAAGLVVIGLMYSYRYFFYKERLRVTSQKIWHKAKQFFTGAFIILFVRLFLISLFCFFLNSIFFFYLCHLVLDFHIQPYDMFNVYAALGIANYSSIITPGVPSGLGVKESVSFLLISAYGYPKEMLLMSILVYRVACILGDLLSFLFVIFYPAKCIVSNAPK